MKIISYIISCCFIGSFLTSCQTFSNEKNVTTSTNNVSETKSLVTPANAKIATDTKIRKEENKKYSDLPILVEDAEFGYYCSEDGIYKVNKKTEESKCILKLDKVSNLILSEGYIYFIENYNNNNKDYSRVSRIDVNGNNYSTVFDCKQISFYFDQQIRDFLLIGNTLYLHQNCSGLYSYNMKTNQLLQIHNNVTKFDVIGDYVYYNDHAERTFSIYRKNIKTMKTEIVLGEGKTFEKYKGAKNPECRYKDFVFVDGKLYYTRRDGTSIGVYCYNDGRTIAKSNEDAQLLVWDFGLLEYGKKLYYFMNDKGSFKMMKYDPINKTSSQVATLKDSNPSIINGYICDGSNRIKIND